MIHIIEPTYGNLVATRANGKLTKEDYEKILPVLNQLEEKYPKIRWYFEMAPDFDGWSLKAAAKDLNFDLSHAKQLEKIAMVGDKKWEEWLTEIMKPFTSAEIKFFELSQKEEAQVWIIK